jgi:hypothetical protein
VSQASRAEAPVVRRRGPGGLVLVWGASALVLALALLASFRLPLAWDLTTALMVNGPRVAFGAAVGGLFALAGALRLDAGKLAPLGGLALLGLSAGGASGGLLLAGGEVGTAALVRFGAGAVLGAGLFLALTRLLDRPRRWTNLVAGLALLVLFALAALAESRGRVRNDPVTGIILWALGDLSQASGRSALVLLGALVAVWALANGPAWDGLSRDLLGLGALGLAIGAAGPLAFVMGLIPRAVRALIPGASAGLFTAASAAAGAAAVVAIDGVPRLLVGGYALSFNVAAAMLAAPIFLTWNRVRLKREAGRAPLAFEIFEIGFIAALTLLFAALAYHLVGIIRAAT